jgi:biotin carboxyl carrier protein
MTDDANHPPSLAGQSSGEQFPGAAAPPKKGLPPRATLAILGVVLLFVLMPYLFWQASWFGRPLTDQQLSRYLDDSEHPRNAQHGLVQLSERIDHREPGVSRWYPQVIALTRNPETQVRITAAWVMGRDNTSAEFHQALLALLADADPMVRSNAALSLVRFGDAAGRPQIHAMLEPAVVTAPRAGTFNARLKITDVVRPGTLVARIVVPPAGKDVVSDGKGGKGSSAGERIEVRSAVPGRVERWLVADGAAVIQGQPLLELSPSPDTVWEALRALYLIGQPDDLAVVQNFTRASGDMPPGIAQQAALTLAAIRSRSGS